MKKILCLMAMAVMLFTSCLENQEPTSLIELRQAKAALITAQAAYKTAEAALKQAEVEFQNALTAEQVLLNEMQSLLNEAQAIQNEIDALELELRQAENAAEIARYEALKTQYENELLSNQHEREKMLKQHERDMYDLLQQVAQAELDYENALKLMEASKLHLTEDQQAIVDNYVAALTALRYGGTYVNIAGVRVTVSESLSDLRQELIEANANLKNAEYNWNHNERIAYAVLDSAAAKEALDQTIKALEDFIAFGEDPDIKKWEAAAAEIEVTIREVLDSGHVLFDQINEMTAELEGLDVQLDQIDIEAGYIANNPYIGVADDAPDATSVPVVVESKKYVAEQSRIALKDSLDEAMTADSEIDRSFDLKVTEVAGLREWMISEINWILPMEQDILLDPNTMKYSLESNIAKVEFPLYQYDASVPEVLADNYDMIGRAKQLRTWIDTYSRTEVEGLDFQAWYHKNNPTLEQVQIRYNKARAKWDAVANAVTEAIAAYKIGSDYDAQNTLYNAWLDFDEIATPTDAQIQAYLDAYTKYITLRQPLDGKARTIMVSGEEKNIVDYLKVANWGTIITEAVLQPIREENKLTLSLGYDKLSGSELYLEDNFDKNGLFPRWEYLSKELWGKEYQRVATDTYLGDDFEFAFTRRYIQIGGNTFSSYGYYNVGDVAEKLVELGYQIRFPSDIDVVINEYNVGDYETDQYFYLIFDNTSDYGLWEVNTSNHSLYNNNSILYYNQDVVNDLLAQLDKVIADFEAEFAGIEEDIEEYLLADKAIEEKIEAIVEEYNAYVKENQAPILERKVALADEMLQMQMLVAKYSAEVEATQELHEHYMTMIDAYYMLFSEDLNSPESLEELNAEIQDIIAEYNEEIIELSEDLNDAKKALLELRNGTDNDSVLYEKTLERCTDKVKEIEEQIDARIAEIEKYEDLLKNTLEVFAGADDENA
ncbi:MAG: hypothetical protein IKW65_07320 [Bacteroidales bacterium]|nr:hypothetical protein [Bacteroidales bacterium]